MSRGIRRVFLAALAGGWLLVVLGVALQFTDVRSRREAGAIQIAVGLALVLGFTAVRVQAEGLYGDEFRSHLFRVLAGALRRGESAGGALAALGREFEGPRGETILRVLGSLDEGRPLAEALDAGGPGLLALRDRESLEAVEGTGRAAALLESMADAPRDAGAVWRRVMLPLAYGVLLFSVGAFLASFVLPRWAEMGGGIQSRLDRPMDTSTFEAGTRAARLYPFLLDTALAGAVIAWGTQRALRSRRLGPRVAALAMGIPAIGTVLRLRAAERVCRVMAVLVEGGAPLHEALSRAAPSAGNVAVEESLLDAAAAASRGESVARVLAGTRLPPGVALRAAAASGGRTESFSSALEGLAVECGERARLRAAALASSLYPAVLASAAVLAFLVYRGTFSMLSEIQGALRPW